jgi:hypothetical protein
MTYKTMLQVSTAIAMALAMSGCATMNRIPEFATVSIEPSTLKPGESAILMASVSDSFGIVRRVEALVIEDKRVRLRLKNDGLEPDLKADDVTWTLRVDVPMQAPPGEFNLELQAFDLKGNTILVPGPGGNNVPLTSTCKLVIAPL